MLRSAMAEEKYLQVERPLSHIGVKIGQVGIVGHGLEAGVPAQSSAQPLGQRGFARADVARDEHESFRHVLLRSS